ncbi:Citrate synthase-like protein, partial [mine drainage metagenome]
MGEGSGRRGGLEGVILGPSGISLPEGREGRLWFRGYDAAELALRLPYASIAYLLIWGDPPPRDPPAEIEEGLRAGRELARRVLPVLDRLPSETSPLDAARTGLSALGEVQSGFPGQREQGLALAGAVAELLAA